jgi:hypothetical protein
MDDVAEKLARLGWKSEVPVLSQWRQDDRFEAERPTEAVISGRKQTEVSAHRSIEDAGASREDSSLPRAMPSLEAGRVSDKSSGQAVKQSAPNR